MTKAKERIVENRHYKQQPKKKKERERVTKNDIVKKATTKRQIRRKNDKSTKNNIMKETARVEEERLINKKLHYNIVYENNKFMKNDNLKTALWRKRQQESRSTKSDVMKEMTTEKQDCRRQNQ